VHVLSIDPGGKHVRRCNEARVTLLRYVSLLSAGVGDPVSIGTAASSAGSGSVELRTRASDLPVCVHVTIHAAAESRGQ
jgi:hypothetical protein